MISLPDSANRDLMSSESGDNGGTFEGPQGVDNDGDKVCNAIRSGLAELDSGQGIPVSQVKEDLEEMLNGLSDSGCSH